MLILNGRIATTIALLIIVVPLGSVATPDVTVNSPIDGFMSTTNNITFNGTAVGPDVRWQQTSDTDFLLGAPENITIFPDNISLLRLKTYDDFDDEMLNTQKWAAWSYGGFYNEELNGMLVQWGDANTNMQWVPGAIVESTATYNSAFADLKAWTANGDFAITIKLVQDGDNAVGIGVKRDPSYNPDIRYIGYILQSGVESQDVLGSVDDVIHTYGIVSSNGMVQAYVDGTLFKTYSISLTAPKIQLNTTARTWGQSASAGWDNVRTTPNLYSLSGVYTSGANDTRAIYSVLRSASWHSDVPAGTNLSVQIRSADEIDMSNPTAWATVKNGQTSGLPSLKRFIQYRTMMSSATGNATPALYDIEFGYHVPIEKVEVSIDNQGSWSLATGSEQWHITLVMPENTSTVWVRATDNTGDMKMVSHDINIDTTPPQGTVLINWGEDFTDSRDVILDCQISDNYGVKSALVSERLDFSGANWQDYHKILSFKLSNGDGVKTLYTKFRDQNGWESDIINNSILLDTSTPTGSVSINNGSEYTNDLMVTLSLEAQDSTYVDEMMVSNEVGFSGALWSPFNSTIRWRLADAGEKHTVFVKFRDAAQHESVVVNDSIIFDTLAPTIKASVNSGAIYTNMTTVILSLNATDNHRVDTVDISEDPLFSNIIQKKYDTSVSYEFSPVEGPRTLYIRATDAAGNTGPVNLTGIILDISPPASGLSELPADTEDLVLSMNWSGTDSISGIKWFDLQYRDGTGPWTDWLQHSSKTSSIFSAQPGHNYSFRLRAVDNAGNRQEYPAGAGATVIVRQKYIPEISITSPKELSEVSGMVGFKGKAHHPDDRRQVQKVEVKIDDGDWTRAAGTQSWKFSLDTGKLPEGGHTLYARAFDGERYSTEAVCNFTVTKVKPGFEQQSTFILAGIMVILAVIGGAFVVHRRKGRSLPATRSDGPGETSLHSEVPDKSLSRADQPTPVEAPEEVAVRAEKELKIKENIIRMIEEPVPQKEKNAAEVKADEEAARTAAILKALSSLPRGLPSSLMGIEMEDLAKKVAQAQRRWSPEGDIIIKIDDHWYYGDERNLGLFMQKFGK